MRTRFAVLTPVLSAIFIAGCYNLNPSEYQGEDAPSVEPNASRGGTAEGGVSGGLGGSGGAGGDAAPGSGGASGGLDGGGARVPDAPNARADVPIGGRDGGTGGSGGKGGNLVRNGGFDSGMTNWDTYEMNGGVATFSISGGELECVISTTTTASTNIQLQYTGGLNLVSGHNYRFTFDAYATADRALDTSIWENGHDLDNNGFAWSTYQYSWHSLTTTKQPFTVDFTMPLTNTDAGIAFFLDGDAATVYIDDVALNELP